MEFIVTGTFKYTAKSFANGAVAEREETGNISEIVYASSAESAAEIADQIFARYEAQYGGVEDRRVIDTAPAVATKAAPAATETAATAEEQCEVAPAKITQLTARLVCRKCGVVGTAGQGYPFSTLPASTCVCDDCGA